MKAIILKWIPWCGKSTLAKQYKENWYMIFNNDSVRAHFPDMKEINVKQLILDDIRTASLVWKDIVRDNTHINQSTLDNCKKYCEDLWYDVEVIDVFRKLRQDIWTPSQALDLCLLRNSKREWISSVPNSVIIDMYLKDWYKLTDKEVILCDLDGTLYNIEHRLPYVKDWARFESDDEISKDKIYPMVRDAIRALSEKYHIIFLSWRRNTYEAQTIRNLERDWLFKSWDELPDLLMRNSWDSRKDDIVKEEFYETISKNHKIVAAFDDRKMVCDLWKKKWLYLFNCCQRESNDF